MTLMGLNVIITRATSRGVSRFGAWVGLIVDSHCFEHLKYYTVGAMPLR